MVNPDVKWRLTCVSLRVSVKRVPVFKLKSITTWMITGCSRPSLSPAAADM
jgi:hypothetical protein